eukprot:TRINITY_DN6981_c0_g1_i1.p1 TRINITY_DN6981_c0_g1~~TRINITY_DN6981_c0_g1_i1.p1  ORF type:complete len:432 (+),score=63.81 TRINITY_DN6981_c0_g1_i1:3-1298(+)
MALMQSVTVIFATLVNLNVLAIGLSDLKTQSKPFIDPAASKWQDTKRFKEHRIYPSVGRLCRKSVQQSWAHADKISRLQLCREIDARSLDIRLDIASQYLALNDYGSAKSYLQSIANEAYSRNREGKNPKNKDTQVQYARAIGALVMTLRNHPTQPDPETAAAEFHRANQSLSYIHWPDTMTLCSDYNPALRSQPWWGEEAKASLPDIAELERQLDVMRTELDRFVHDGIALGEDLDAAIVARGSWTEYQLWQDGHFNQEHCMHFPWTCLHASKAIAVTGWQRYTTDHTLRGQVMLLKMTPDTHLRTHTGESNSRLVVQLPLIAPDGVHIRVANTTHKYTPDSALVFDDCYEHEVRHLGSTNRYVLYMTMHHPDLNLDLHRPDWYNEKLLGIAQEALAHDLLDESGFEQYKRSLNALAGSGKQQHARHEEL